MKVPPVPIRPKRSGWWYIGVAIAGACGLLVLCSLAFVITKLTGSKPYSIVVSADDHTYLTAVTARCYRDVWADDCSVTVVDYVRDNGWFQSAQRIRVFECQSVKPEEVRFRQLTRDGKQEIEVLRCARSIRSPCDPAYSSVLFTFAIPENFDEFARHGFTIPYCN